MDEAKPSLARRAVAVLVLAIVAVVAARVLFGAIMAIFWLVAVIALLVAALWAVSTLRGSGRREGRVKRTAAADTTLAPPSYEDRVEAQMRELQEQLRKQGRL